MVERFTHSLTGTEGILLWEVVQLQLMITMLRVVDALNVAVLIYARTAARQSEIAVRYRAGCQPRARGRATCRRGVRTGRCSGTGFALAQIGVRAVNRIMEAGWK